MAGAARAASEAQDRLFASMRATQDLMDRMAGGASAAAAAESRLADAEGSAASAAEDAAAGAAQAAAAAQNQAASVSAAAAAEDAAAEAAAKLAATSQAQASAVDEAAAANARLIATSRVLADAAGAEARAIALVAATDKLLAEQAGNAAKSQLAAGAAAIAATIAAASITRNAGALGTWVHWIIAGGAELLAVLIPALVALGAAAAVASQSVQNISTHMQALHTATEATANVFHTTMGQALGLGNALQRAQNAAQPGVYSILGGAVDVLSHHFGNLASVGLQVTGIMQSFAARMVYDFGAGGMGGTVHALLAGMVTDLVQFGQILGNTGHALLDFAAAMPGLAHVLLSVVDGVSRLILWVSQLPPWLITTVMVFEEAWRWGGLLASIVLRLAQAFALLGTLGIPAVVGILTNFGTMIQSAALGVGLFFENLGKVIAGIPVFTAATDAAGAAVAGFGGTIFDAVAGISAWQLGLGVVAAAGLGFLIYKLATAKSATQQLVDSMQAATDKANGFQVFSTIGTNMAKMAGQLAQVTTGANGSAVALTTMAGVASRLAGPSFTAAGAAAATLSAGLTQQQHDLLNSAQAVTFLSDKYGVDFAGALALGTQAGIQWDAGIGKMSQAAELNLIKVMNLMHGYQLMGQGAGTVGKDMTVIGLEAALTATKIQQLTQAWDSWIGQITGGTSTLATFEQDLQNLGTKSADAAGAWFAATGRMNSSTAAFARSLQSFTGQSAQNWQNFDQAVSSGAQQFIDWMDTAGAMGVAKGAQINAAIKGIVLQMIPFATQSQAARVALAQLDAQTGQTVAPTTRALEAFNKSGDSAKQLAKFLNDTTLAMGDMAKVAANLGAVMQSDLVSMFDKAKIAASGLPGDLSSLSNALRVNGYSSSAAHTAMINVIRDLVNLHTSVPTITALLNTMGIHITQTGVAAIVASGQLHNLSGAENTAAAAAANASGQTWDLVQAIANLHSKSVTLTTYYQSVGLGNRGGHTGTGPGYAGGTSSATPGVHPVAEMGAELLLGGTHDFQGGEKVVPAAQTARILAGGGGGGVTVNLTVQGHVMTEMQLMDFIRDGVQEYIPRNPDDGFQRRGRSF